MLRSDEYSRMGEGLVTAPMSRVKRNLIANFLGTGWLTLSGLIFAPIYIRLMGAEAYGLIGFYYTLQAALQVFDFGLSPTINREMARYSVQSEHSGEARDFVRTFEIGYWAIGLVLGILVWGAAPLLTTQWLKVDTLNVEAVQSAVTSMAVLIVLQWPLTLYEGGLLGLQRHVLLNTLSVAMTALRTIGAVLFLWLVSPTIVNFFLWQIVASLVHVALITMLFWRNLPPLARAPRLDVRLARRVWQFAAGMTGNTLAWFILSQLDKIILSGAISLEAFGYYTLASSMANSLRLMVASPIFNAIYPRFSALAAVADARQLRSFYHLGAQLIAVLIFPLAAVLGIFSYEITLMWIGMPLAAQSMAPLAGALIIGTSLSALEAVPYALGLAHGWTSLGLLINVGSILIYVPTVLLMVKEFGAIGAAVSWAAVGAIRILLLVPLTHRRLLKGEALRWFWADNCAPLLGAVTVVLLGRLIVSGLTSTLALITCWLVVLAVALIVSTLLARDMRVWTLAQIERRWRAAAS
jgi:O-antigen/teichoic acid export membrane protein